MPGFASRISNHRLQAHAQARRMIAHFGHAALDHAVMQAMDDPDEDSFNWSVVREIDKRLGGVHHMNRDAPPPPPPPEVQADTTETVDLASHEYHELTRDDPPAWGNPAA